ncbi:ABC transporter substrate-binding protein [Actinomyces sp. B33]|uniref:siderophore ABC transporter substrate-binding protein n=1 Tax=Actinomyces sp. B33 TaxID=2942131 RepID=UPI00233F8CF3|nr:ABC transporter substrate-binding protein [Actinomyces sp. B33]MDC4233931.1 ABC transporter substrate-binding protein [Actinomyces sp. B33]
MNGRTASLLAAPAALALLLAGCSGAGDAAAPSAAQSSAEAIAQSSASNAAPASATIESNLGTVEIALPVQRAASLDNRTFEVLASWGVPLVAAPQNLIPKTITAYSGEDVANIGTHREPNLEALVAAEPDLIISGQRFTQHNEAIASLTDAPLIDLEPREGEPLDAELIRQVEALGTIFGKEKEAAALVDDFTTALDRAKKAYDGSSTVMAVNVSGGEIGYVAPSVGRTWGPLFDLLGLTPALEVPAGTDSHTGDDISVEAIAESNPAWILVLDRDGAIKAEEAGYTPAADVIAANAALSGVSAVADQHVIVAPADTYTNESIITYTEILNSLADAFEAAGAQR